MFSTTLMFINFFKYKRKFIDILKRTYSNNHLNKNSIKVLFFGTDQFSMPSLKSLYEEGSTSYHKISTLGVVTSFKSASNPVRNFANKQNLEIFDWPVSENIASQYDLGVVVSFGHLIPTKIISCFKLGMINVHASMLPRWRGAAPIVYAIKSGDQKTGVSIMKIKPKHFDTGEVLAQREVNIDNHMLMPELHDKLSKDGANLLLECIKRIPDSLDRAVSQKDELATYAPKITQSFAEAKWDVMTASQVYNLYRSLYSFKNLTTTFNNQKIKLIELLRYDIEKSLDGNPNKVNHPPGLVEFSKFRKCLRVYCADGKYIEVLKIRVEGKKVMSALDFDNGFLKKSNNNKFFT